MFQVTNLCAIHAGRVTIMCEKTCSLQGVSGEGIGDVKC
ncbi:hypothetical protein ACP70R_034171 [Stipagrostis hirtigluma subsp. patula]